MCLIFKGIKLKERLISITVIHIISFDKPDSF